ncbi:ATP-grasp domain-containing protein [Lysinibacillus mangiferihumi]|uniref:ATP-grasp domain-containing protein n=1 Tax=Lysinibacillus mangiferihumi TaxID=1130819 RepID=A0A4U2YGC5_9BACI|nr:ATP-grasp domain-containing protein [Lysinibacillus mangiferihumi]TKI60057.1 ATP-grasp domain-containing protein [Lysinibacillus mangiferihumi]
MRNTRNRLLIVDAPGGPAPSVYLPMLSDEFEVGVALVVSENSVVLEERLNFLGERVQVYIIENRLNLKEELEEISNLFNAEGLLAFSERIVHDVNEVARKLNLPSNPTWVQKCLYNKEHQRTALSHGGLVIPKVYKILDYPDLKAAAKEVGFPAVLKPLIGIGSLSTYEVQSIEELEEIYYTAIDLYKTDARIQAVPNFLLEEKIPGFNWHGDDRYGDHVSVESIVSNGEIVHLTVTDKLPLAFPFRETGDIMPTILSDFQVENLYKEAELAIRALGIEVGAVHTEIKLTKEGPRIIEVNGRVGGGITEMLSYSADYNIINELAKVAVGMPLSKKKPDFKSYCGFFTPQPPALDIELEKVPNLDELLAMESVREAVIVYSVGMKPDWKIGTGSNLLRVLAVSDNKEEILALGTRLINLSLFSFK